MNIERKDRGPYPMAQLEYLPTPCMHCGEASCIAASPEDTIHRRADGLVIIDLEKVKDHPEIVGTCPSDVMYLNDDTRLRQKCSGCSDLLDASWTETRCSQRCPNGALELVLADDAAMATKAAAEGLETFQPQFGTNPRVCYKNLRRWTGCFLGGAVAYSDTDNCAEGAAVIVTADGRVIGEAVTDSCGDFLIDGLEPGHYDLIIGASGYDPAIRRVDIMESKSLGLILLDRPWNGR